MATTTSAAKSDKNIFVEVEEKKKLLENFYYKIDVIERNLLYKKDMEEEERTKLEKRPDIWYPVELEKALSGPALFTDMEEEERTKLERELNDMKRELRKAEAMMGNLNAEKMYNYTVATMLFIFFLCVFALVRLSRIAHEEY